MGYKLEKLYWDWDLIFLPPYPPFSSQMALDVHGSENSNTTVLARETTVRRTCRPASLAIKMGAASEHAGRDASLAIVLPSDATELHRQSHQMEEANGRRWGLNGSFSAV
jgi:hypothetical protein